MRYTLLALGITICIGLGRSLLMDVASTGLSDDALAAIDIRCGTSSGTAERECRELHTKLFLAGTLDPDKTLRRYCEPAATIDWNQRRAAAPALCLERYGGWRNG